MGRVVALLIPTYTRKWGPALHFETQLANFGVASLASQTLASGSSCDATGQLHLRAQLDSRDGAGFPLLCASDQFKVLQLP